VSHILKRTHCQNHSKQQSNMTKSNETSLSDEGRDRGQLSD